jgi:hypothetical protein
VPKKCGISFIEVWIPQLLDSIALDLQHSLFVLTMKNNSKAMVKLHTCNPLTRLWKQLTSSQIVTHKIPKYIKLVEIAVLQVIGSMEDELCFNMFNFMKTKLRNKLMTHLDLVTRMFGQKLYTLENFLYNQAIEKWKTNYMVCMNCFLANDNLQVLCFW